MTNTADVVWRDWNTQGVPSSGDRKPVKSEIRTWARCVENRVGVGVSRRTAVLLAAVTPAANTYPLGAVTNDPDPAKNGFWTWSGSAWAWSRPFPDTLATLTNVGGTANAITASSRSGVDPSEVLAFIIQPAQTNTGSVTLSIDGAAAKPLLDFQGTALAPGAIIAGQLVLLIDNGDEYRLLLPALAVASFDHKGDYAGGTTYTEGQLVTGTNGAWYQLKVPSALGDDPVGSVTGNWLQVLSAAALPDGGVTVNKLSTDLQDRVDPLRMARVCYSEADLDALDRSKYNVALLVTAARKTMFFWDAGDHSGEIDFRSITTRSVASSQFSMGQIVSSGVSGNIITSVDHGLVANTTRLLLQATTNGARRYAVWKPTFDSGTAGAAGGDDDNFKITGWGNSNGTAYTLTGTSQMTFDILHDLTTGEALRVKTATADFDIGDIVYAVVTSNYQFQVAATYADAVAAIPVTITIADSTPVEFAIHEDPLHMATFVPSDIASDGSQGAWVTGQKDIAAADVGLVDGANCTHAVQASAWLSFYRKCLVNWPSGLFYSDYEVRHLTASYVLTLHQGNTVETPNNGIRIRGTGQQRSLLRASSNFPDSSDILRFDGNRYGVEHYTNAALGGGGLVGQGRSFIEGVGIEGRGVSTGSDVQGISIRATQGLVLSDVHIWSVSGVGLLHRSAVAAGSSPADEVENVLGLVLRDFEIQRCGKEGILATQARLATIHADNINVRYCGKTGIKGGFTYGHINGWVASCGNATDTGCVHILNADSATATGSLARLLDLSGLNCESGYDFEMYIEEARLVQISGTTLNSALSTCRYGLRLGAGAQDIIVANMVVNKSGVHASYKEVVAEAGAKYLHFTHAPVNFSGSAPEIALASPDHVHIVNPQSGLTVTQTGSAAVDSFNNYATL